MRDLNTFLNDLDTEFGDGLFAIDWFRGPAVRRWADERRCARGAFLFRWDHAEMPDGTVREMRSLIRHLDAERPVQIDLFFSRPNVSELSLYDSLTFGGWDGGELASLAEYDRFAAEVA